MSALKRYTKAVDGTIPVPALLYQDEDILASQDGVGIYDGAQKSAPHQAGAIHASTHRLFYIDSHHPRSRSFALDLSHVSRTDYWAGLLRSSAKITLYLNAPPTRVSTPGPTQREDNRSATLEGFDVWECAVCSYRNPPGLSPSASMVCGLCGVPRAAVPTSSTLAIPVKSTRPDVSTNQLSTSLPSSSQHLPISSSDPPSHTEPTSEIACPACTFLNHPSLPACEICGTTLPRPHRPAARSAPASRPASDDEDDEDETADVGEAPRMIKISFRKGGDKAFYAVLRRSLLDKIWEGPKLRRAPVPTSQEGSGSATPNTLNRSGIHGILQEVQTTAAATQTTMEDALQDLETLKIQAREMVRYAEELNERLTALSAQPAPPAGAGAGGAAPVEPEEATFIRSSLAQLGLQMANAPVTLDMIRDERRWHEELARELAGVLQGSGRAAGDQRGMMRRRGIVGLDEVWGGWNRARGVSLIPPSTFLQVLPYLPAHTEPPINKRTFSSGLSVLHTPPYSKAAFSARLVGLLSLAGPRTTVEVAYEEQLPIGLVQDMVFEVEEAGDICRDEGEGKVGVSIGGRSQEVHWWGNIFQSYVWDGQAD